jgi:hypothetical protein
VRPARRHGERDFTHDDDGTVVLELKADVIVNVRGT